MSVMNISDCGGIHGRGEQRMCTRYFYVKNLRVHEVKYKASCPSKTYESSPPRLPPSYLSISQIEMRSFPQAHRVSIRRGSSLLSLL